MPSGSPAAPSEGAATAEMGRRSAMNGSSPQEFYSSDIAVSSQMPTGSPAAPNEGAATAEMGRRSVKEGPSPQDYRRSIIVGGAYTSDDTAPRNPLDMTGEQQAQAVSFHVGHVSEFFATLQLLEGHEDRLFFFGGASNVLCPEPATCERFACPPGYRRRTMPEIYRCRTSVCSSVDVDRCCSVDVESPCHPDHVLWLSPANVLHSNLGGFGPDVGRDGSLLITNVFPLLGKRVDLKITAGAGYQPQDGQHPSVLGWPSGMLELSAANGSEAEFQFAFLGWDGAATDATGQALGAEDDTKLFYGMFLSEGGRVDSRGSPLALAREAPSKLTIPGGITDDVNEGAASRPLRAISVEEQSGIPMVLNAAETLTVKLSSHLESGERLTFAGASSRACPMRASCSTYTCPRGWVVNKLSSELLCRGSTCGNVDRSRCCQRWSPDLCRSQNSLVISAETLVHANLGGYGPDLEAPASLLFADVLPGSQDAPVDLRITADEGYSPGTVPSWSTGLYHGAMGLLGVASGTSATFRFQLWDRSTGRPLLARQEPFLLSLLGLRRVSAGVDRVTLRGPAVVSYKLSPASRIGQQDDILQVLGLTDGSEAPESGELQSPLALPHDTASRSIVFQVRNTSEVTFDFQAARGAGKGWLLFSGASGLVCPKRALCTSMDCPDGYGKRWQPNTKLCEAEECDARDVKTCCMEGHSTRCEEDRLFSLRHVVQSHRLPEAFAPMRSVVFGNVFPGSGRKVDLELMSLGRDSKINVHRSDGSPRELVRVDVKGSMSVDLQFRFVDRASGHATRVPQFWLSFVLEPGQEVQVPQGWRVRRTMYSNIEVAGPSLEAPVLSLRRAIDGSGPTAFPPHPMALAREHLDHLVSVAPAVADLQELHVTFKDRAAHGPGAGGSFRIHLGGASSLVCPARSLCSSFTCPHTYALRPDASVTLCGSASCSTADIHTCCVVSTTDACDSERSLELSREKIVFSNLGSRGPDFHQPEGILFGNVFPDSPNAPIDLHITQKNHSQGSGQLPSFGGVGGAKALNGASGGLGLLHVDSHEPVALEFTFYDRRTQHRVTVPPFLFTVLRLDEQAAEGTAIEATSRELQVHKAHAHQEGWMRPRWSHHVTISTAISSVSEAFVTKAAKRYHSAPNHPLALDQEDMDGAITFRFSRTASFRLTSSLSSGQSRHQLLFAGRSNLVCPRRALCSSYECPIGFKSRNDAQYAVCRSSVCDDDDRTMCCMPQEFLPCNDGSRMELSEAKVVRSNLGGLGPDGGPNSIMIRDVFPRSGRSIDLEIRNTSAYWPGETLSAGVDGSRGAISLQRGTSVDLTFTFLEGGNPAKNCQLPGRFLFSMLSMAGLQVTVMNGAEFQHQTAPTSDVGVTKNGAHLVVWSAKTDHRLMMPGHPMDLPDEHLKTSAAVLLPAEASFSLSVYAYAVSHDNVFMFAGASNVVCSARAFCSSFLCPRGWGPIRAANSTACRSSSCTEADMRTCCTESAGSTDVGSGDPCDDSHLLHISADNLVHSNLGGSGPDADVPPTIVYANIFPASDRTIDLEVSVLGSVYTPHNLTANGVAGARGSLNMKAGTAASLSLTFLDRRLRTPFVPPPFWLTLFEALADGASDGTSDFDVLEVRGNHSSVRLADNSEVLRPVDESAGNGSISSSFKLPVHRASASVSHQLGLAMDERELSRAVSFHVGETVSLRLEATAVLGSGSQAGGHTVFFGGATSLVCPRRDSCSSVRCPRGFWRSSDNVCAGSRCLAEDTSRCCVPMDVAACALTPVFQQNKLKVVKPGSLITIQDIFLSKDEQVAVSFSVEPDEKATRQETKDTSDILSMTHDGVVSLLQLSSDFRMQVFFTCAGKGRDPCAISDPVYLSLLEAGRVLRCVESIQVKAIGQCPEGVCHVAWNFSGNVAVTRGGNASTIYSAHDDLEEKGSKEELSAAASILLPSGVQGLSMYFRINNSRKGWCDRPLMFKGGSTTACPRQHCSEMRCPVGYSLKADAANIACATSTCQGRDVKNCCFRER